MCRAREESLPKDVSHVHRKAGWRVDLAWLSSSELVWNEALQSMQVFAADPSRLVCSKKLDNRAFLRIREFSVGEFLGRVVVSKVGWAWEITNPRMQVPQQGSERRQDMGSIFWVAWKQATQQSLLGLSPRGE